MLRRSKVWLNFALDRVTDQCNSVLMEAYRLPPPFLQGLAQSAARHTGDACWSLRDFPRLSAYRVSGAGWAVVFVGSSHGLSEIRRLLFGVAPVAERPLGRVTVWQIGEQAHQWLADGAALVVCELANRSSWSPSAPITISVPTWVEQVLDLPEPLDKLLAGKRAKSLRGLINRCQGAGLSYRFSESPADFDYFRDHMYLPFVRRRHDDLVLVTPYQDHRKSFARGGLILITEDDRPIAGVLCYIAGETCYLIEEGVLEASEHLWQQGINAFLLWSAMTWAHGRGARQVDLGASHAWCTSGSFAFKRRWGARVMRRRRIHGTWTLLMRSPSPSLLDHLNRMQLITEIDGSFYMSWLKDDRAPLASSDISTRASAAREQGLAGLAVTSPKGTETFC